MIRPTAPQLLATVVVVQGVGRHGQMPSAGLGPRFGRQAAWLLAALVVLAAAASASPARAAGPYILEIAEDFAGTGFGAVTCKYTEGGIAVEEEACTELEFETKKSVTLIPVPEEGSTFIGFTNGEGSASVCKGLTKPCTFTLGTDSYVEARFDEIIPTLVVKYGGTGEGEVSCAEELGPPEACEDEYPWGTEITLWPEAFEGSEFLGFKNGTGSAVLCVGKEPCSFELKANTTIEAQFGLIPRTLTIKKAGTGSGEVKCKVNGGSAETCAASYPNGTKLELVATANAGSEFKGFSSGTGSAEECKTSPCAFEIELNSSVTATFDLKPGSNFTLTVKKTGLGSGIVTSFPAGVNCGVTCSAEFEGGAKVTLSKSADLGSEFVKWSGACSGTGACEVTMSSPKEVTAEFKLKATPEFKLTIAKAGTGQGTVTCNGTTCAASYPAGTEVTLAATAASGSIFVGWSGGGCSGTASCKVTLNADTTVTATFNKEEVKLSPTEGTAKAAATARVKSGKAELKLTCSGGPCKGTLKLTAKIKSGGKIKNLTIGKASFSLAAGAKKTLKVKLSGAAKTALRKGPLKVKLRGTGVASSTIKLKLG